jgi:hypothetical protein
MDYPPPLKILWLQSILFGIGFAWIFKDRTLLASMFFAIIGAIVVTWFSAICSMLMVTDIGFRRRIEMGVGGFGYILILIFPNFLLAAIPVVALRAFHYFWQPNMQFKKVGFSISDILMMILVLSVVFWQISIFYKFKAFSLGYHFDSRGRLDEITYPLGRKAESKKR